MKVIKSLPNSKTTLWVNLSTLFDHRYGIIYKRVDQNNLIKYLNS
jgi:hypothetical protein